MDSRTQILFLDDSPVFRDGLRQGLERVGKGRFQVITAASLAEAEMIIKESKIDLCLLDIDLSGENLNGIDFAKKIRTSHEDMGIILITAHDDYYLSSFEESVDNAISKFCSANDIIQAIDLVLYNRSKIKEAIKTRWPKLYDKMEVPRAIKFIKREFQTEKDGTVEKITGETWDGHNVCFNIYRLSLHRKNNLTISIATTLGCTVKCWSCMYRDYMRPLTVDEMQGQVFLALNSQLVAKYLDDWKELPQFTVTTSGEGDILVNNCKWGVDFLRSMHELTEGDWNYIITSVGVPKALDFCARTVADLPIRMYWSVHSCIQEQRKFLQPGSFPLQRTLEAYLRFRDAQIKARPGEKVDEMTLAYLVIKDINDSEENLDACADFVRHNPLKVKFMTFGPHLQADRKGSERHLRGLCQELLSRGIRKCRRRNIIGWDIWGSCGNMVPRYNFPDIKQKEKA